MTEQAKTIEQTQDETVIRLEELIPQAAKFTLRLTGETYELRPVDMDDEVWMAKEFGKGIEKIFREIQMGPICRIVFHQMTDESRAKFKKQTVKIIDEDGNEKSEDIGGVRLLQACISGTDEKLKIFEALQETLGISRPIIDKLGIAEKKRIVLETGRPSVGESSLSSSQASTGSQLSGSESPQAGQSGS